MSYNIKKKKKKKEKKKRPKQDSLNRLKSAEGGLNLVLIIITLFRKCTFQ